MNVMSPIGKYVPTLREGGARNIPRPPGSRCCRILQSACQPDVKLAVEISPSFLELRIKCCNLLAGSAL